MTKGKCNLYLYLLEHPKNYLLTTTATFLFCQVMNTLLMHFKGCHCTENVMTMHLKYHNTCFLFKHFYEAGKLFVEKPKKAQKCHMKRIHKWIG